MKALNNTERKSNRLKFIGMYCVSIVLIIVVLCAFLQPVPATKTVMVEKEKPPAVITKTIYVTKKSAAINNNQERDSLMSVINFNTKKVNELNAFIQSQEDTIAILQSQATGKHVVNGTDKNEVAKLNKQIEFYDWALRSQIAVTNTLAKENNSLKNKIAGLGRNN